LLFTAGAAGGFLVAMIRGLSRVGIELSCGNFRIDTALLVLARFGYLAWLMVYFFFSQLRAEHGHDQDEQTNMWFAAFQVILAFGCALFLGFGEAELQVEPGDLRGFVVVNLGILLIAGVALKVFHASEHEKETVVTDGKLTRLNALRRAGIVLSSVGAISVFSVGHFTENLALQTSVVWLFLLAHWAAVLHFARLSKHNVVIESEQHRRRAGRSV
jgi:hypothetical protein